MRKHVLPAAKREGADLMEFAATDIAEVVSGRKNFKKCGKTNSDKTVV